MSRKRIAATVSIIAILLVLVGGTAWLYIQKLSDQQNTEQTSNQDNAIQEPKEPAKSTHQKATTAGKSADTPVSAEPGTYQNYSQAALKNAGNRERVLFFHASWCPQCRALDADIKDKGVPAGIAIFKIDYDSNQALRQKYGVTQQTTVVYVDAEGNKIRSFLPYSDPTLANALNGLGLR